MKKLFLGLFLALVLSGFAFAGDVWVVSDTITNYLGADSAFYPFGAGGYDFENYNAFGYWFKISQCDTIKTDSITISLQTSPDNVNWRTIYSFAEYAADTTTKYKFFPVESLMVYPFDKSIRAKVTFTDVHAANDTGTVDSMLATSNGAVLDFKVIAGTGADTTRWSVLSTIDSTKCDTIKTVNKWLSLGCANHTKHEGKIDSIVLIYNGGWDTDTAWVLAGLCLGGDTPDTTSALRELAARQMLKGLDSTTYRASFTTNPYGTAWNWTQIDSLGMIFKSDSLKSGAVVKLNKAIVYAYLTKGTLFPNIIYRSVFNFKDKDAGVIPKK